MKETQPHTGRTLQLIAAGLLCLSVLWAHSYLPSQASALTAEAIRSLHGPGFGIVALLCLRLLRLGPSPRVPYTTAAVAALLIAVVSEAAQIPMGREAELSDLLVDALGVGGFLGASAVVRKNRRHQLGRPRVVLITLVSIPAILLAVLPTFWLTGALAMRNHLMPQLASFDVIWERAYSAAEDGKLKIITAPDGWPNEAENIAHLESAGRYGLMLHIYPYPDWNGYAAVSFMAATRKGETRKIAVGLWGINPADGTKADSYYTTITIRPTPDRYCIGLENLRDRSSGRPFDIAHMYEMLIGATANKQGVEILVDDFRLEESVSACPNIRRQDASGAAADKD